MFRFDATAVLIYAVGSEMGMRAKFDRNFLRLAPQTGLSQSHNNDSNYKA